MTNRGQDQDHDDFSNVSWSEHVQGQTARTAPSPGNEADRGNDGPGPGVGHDPRGIGRERLECIVGSAIKENDGTKDAFVSYQITTHVGLYSCCQPLLYLCLSPPLSPAWWTNQHHTLLPAC